jgi:hypothetical protein
MTSDQKDKLHRDFIKARDAFHRAVEQVHRDRERLVKAGLVPDDDDTRISDRPLPMKKYFAYQSFKSKYESDHPFRSLVRTIGPDGFSHELSAWGAHPGGQERTGSDGVYYARTISWQSTYCPRTSYWGV